MDFAEKIEYFVDKGIFNIWIPNNQNNTLKCPTLLGEPVWIIATSNVEKILIEIARIYSQIYERFCRFSRSDIVSLDCENFQENNYLIGYYRYKYELFGKAPFSLHILRE